LWAGQFTTLDFADAMFSAMRRGFEQAWREGALECGILPGERSDEEQKELDRMLGDNLTYVPQFGDYIFANSKANGGSIGPILNRAELWVNRYNEVKAKAQLMACKDAKYRWQYGPTEHCKSCLRLNGRVYRASVWAKYGIQPQSHNLACKGYRCQCQFILTKDPVTKGRPPKIP
jgi:hypothetical protein